MIHKSFGISAFNRSAAAKFCLFVPAPRWVRISSTARNPTVASIRTRRWPMVPPCRLVSWVVKEDRSTRWTWETIWKKAQEDYCKCRGNKSWRYHELYWITNFPLKYERWMALWKPEFARTGPAVAGCDAIDIGHWDSPLSALMPWWLSPQYTSNTLRTEPERSLQLKYHNPGQTRDSFVLTVVSLTVDSRFPLWDSCNHCLQGVIFLSFGFIKQCCHLFSLVMYSFDALGIFPRSQAYAIIFILPPWKGSSNKPQIINPGKVNHPHSPIHY